VLFRSKLFTDATGHGSVGALAGADLTVKEEGHLGMSNMWRWKEMNQPAPFPNIAWGLDLDMDDFPYPKRNHAEWFWESGFNKHPISGLESTRDWNFRAIYGAFNAMKNKGGKAEHANAKLEWIAYVGGTRESRQLLGDIILTRDDITNKKAFPDGCVPTTWDIDLHYPKEQYAKKFPDDPFISKAVFDKAVDRQHGYPVPYRCFYSRNIENMFMAGRDISVNHEALGTVRVMKTGGMIGEVVGKAAAICVKHNCTPRDVYHNYLDELKVLMNLKGVMRRDTLDGQFYIPAGAPELPPAGVKYHDPAKLGGIVIDDDQAKLTGTWTPGEGLKEFIGTKYRYASPKSKAVARFEFKVPAAGRYEVRFAYQHHENRAGNAPVTVHSADGQKSDRGNGSQADGEVALVALLLRECACLLKHWHGAAGLAAEAVGVRQRVQRPGLGAFVFQARRAVFAVGEERAQQVNDQLVGPELVVERIGEAVAEERARLVQLPGADGVVVEFDHRGQVFQARHLLHLGHGGEIIAQAGVGGGALGRGQPVVGVAPHNRVQVEPALPGVMVYQPACDEIAQVGIKRRSAAFRPLHHLKTL